MIRFSMQNDLLSIGHVYCAAWKAAYRGIVPDDFLDCLTDENCAPRSLHSCVSLVCEADGRIVGVAAFGARRDQPDEKTGELYSIYVLPEFWRTGAGSALFESARNQLREEGYESLFLWTLTENTRARRFYEKMGMEEYKTRTITIGGRELSETGYFQMLPLGNQ